MRRPKRPWTAEEDVHLRQLLEGGESALLVAAKLKRTPSAVKNRKVAAHIRVGKAPELNEDELMEKEQKWVKRD